MDERIK